jgi:periplasmic copper chaperone A
MKRIYAGFGLALMLLLPMQAAAAGVVSLKNAYAFPTLAGTNNGAAFVTFENHSDSPAFIKAVASDAAKTVELHAHEHDKDGVMSMVKKEEVRVPPHSVIAFEPGGLHVMLTDLKEPLTLGDVFEVRFTLEDGRTLPFNVTVVERK